MRVGFVGWRGMVGSVLRERMLAQGDHTWFDSVFFSASQVGATAPAVPRGAPLLLDARDPKALASCDAIVSCQGSEYTLDMQPRLRAAGWPGYWVDAASALRMHEDALIVLDPLNLSLIRAGLAHGVRNLIGGNCTVSLMLMAVHGLLQADLIEWITAMTYQAASGAGAQHMRELLIQMGRMHSSAAALLADPAARILDIDRAVSTSLHAGDFPKQHLGVPLAGNLIAWIDQDLGNGLSREEWKAGAEANRILGRPAMRAAAGPPAATSAAAPASAAGAAPQPLIVEGLCVRIGAMRCHSQALTIKLRRDIPLADIEAMLAGANRWVQVVPNRREDSVAELSPARVSGSLRLPIGRLRKLAMGGEYLAAFTVGDQLLWGAAEPLRRVLRLLVGKLD